MNTRREPLGRYSVKRSLLFRVGLAMALIISLAVLSMLSSVVITETSQGYAAAINQAGTLRMQSYRIATSLVHGVDPVPDYHGANTADLVEEFRERLYSPRIHNVLDKVPSERVMEAYRTVENTWNSNIEPQLRAYIILKQGLAARGYTQLHNSPERVVYLQQVDDFVQSIHHFVKVLELDAEEKIEQLRYIQIVSVVLILLIAVISLYLTKQSVLTPLKELLISAQAARRGDFSRRSHYQQDDELGQLGHAFNVMAEDLSKIYTDLELRVQRKTADLERSNRSLELLYLTSKRLSDKPPSEEVLQEVVQDIEQQIDIKHVAICLGQQEATGVVCTQVRRLGLQEGMLHCDLCYGHHRAESFITGEGKEVCSIPIKDKNEQYGVILTARSPDKDKPLEAWQKKLLETVASHIALAINMAQRAMKSRMISLLEERSVIARELHDSLAQSLSYLKIQVSRLEKGMRDGNETKKILEISHDLRSALNGAYRQLRELLATFRMQISEAGLGVALNETIDEFHNRSGIPITFEYNLGNCKLNPNSEIHLLQIIRESLSNVIRHADATMARVSLDASSDGMITALVEDNGVGIGSEKEMMLHYGLPIMKERAEWLGGTLEISESEQGGTQVRLRFGAENMDWAVSREAEFTQPKIGQVQNG